MEAANRVSQARNSVYQASQQLQALQSEPLSDTLVSATLAVDQAAIAQAEAAANLEAAQLTAPFSATVMSVSAAAGEQVSANATVLTIATLQEPVVQFWVEEADLAGVRVGNSVNIEFEALPEEVFTGTITRIAPELVEVSGTSAVQAWASLALGDRPGSLLSGMTASVEVVIAQAMDALLVPVEALRAAAGGAYSVVVVNADGSLDTRPVTVGLQSPTQAEILSGLALGETVVVN